MQYSPSPTEGSPTEGSPTGAVIAGVIAVVALTVIITLVVILVLLVRRKQGKVQVSGQLNPFYMEGQLISLVVFIHNLFVPLLKPAITKSRTIL